MSKKAGFIGVAIGAVSGVIAGILLAPKSGKETRKDIKEGAEDLKNKGEKAIRGVKKESEKVIKDGKREGKKIAKRAENTYEGAKKGFNKKVR